MVGQEVKFCLENKGMSSPFALCKAQQLSGNGRHLASAKLRKQLQGRCNQIHGKMLLRRHHVALNLRDAATTEDLANRRAQ